MPNKPKNNQESQVHIFIEILYYLLTRHHLLLKKKIITPKQHQNAAPLLSKKSVQRHNLDLTSIFIPVMNSLFIFSLVHSLENQPK